MQTYYRKQAAFKLPVSGAMQHVRESYVHLALMNYEGHQKSARKNLVEQGSSKQAYEGLYCVQQEIEPPSIFDKYTQVAVIGPAGVGKTTFGKWLAWRWAGDDEHTRYWKQKFHYLYRVPLRYLLSYDKPVTEVANTQDLARFIYHVMGNEVVVNDNQLNELTEDNIAAQLSQSIAHTLFFLDGLDEVLDVVLNLVSKERAHYNNIEKLLMLLLRQPNYVVTSRPHAIEAFAKIQDIGISCQAYYGLVGFTDIDIPEYVKMAFRDQGREESQAEQLIVELEKNQSMWGSSHIPINLSLICQVWNENLFADEAHISMTRLYQIIVQRIFDLNLRKFHKDSSRLRDFVKMELQDQVLFYMPATNFFSELAFAAMLNNQPLLTNDGIEKLLKRDNQDYSLTLSRFFNSMTGESKAPHHCKALIECFLCLGFINAINNFRDNTGYYFIHLTFQEYFAAHYLFQWILDSQSHRHSFFGQDYSDPYLLIKVLADNGRFETMLWFLAGFLKDHPEELKRYFSALVDDREKHLWDEPERLFLVGRCYEEAGLPKYELSLVIRVAYTCLIERILTNNNSASLQTCRAKLIDNLLLCPELMIELNVIEKLNEVKNNYRSAAIVILQLQRTRDILSTLLDIACDPERSVDERVVAMGNAVALQQPSNVALIIGRLFLLLDDEEANKESKKTIYRNLCYLPIEQFPELIEKLVSKLANESIEFRRIIFQVFIERKLFTSEVIKELSRDLSAENPGVRQFAVNTLLSEKELDDVGVREQLIAALFQNLASEYDWIAVQQLTDLGYAEDSRVAKALKELNKQNDDALRSDVSAEQKKDQKVNQAQKELRCSIIDQNLWSLDALVRQEVIRFLMYSNEVASVVLMHLSHRNMLIRESSIASIEHLLSIKTINKQVVIETCLKNLFVLDSGVIDDSLSLLLGCLKYDREKILDKCREYVRAKKADEDVIGPLYALVVLDQRNVEIINRLRELSVGDNEDVQQIAKNVLIRLKLKNYYRTRKLLFGFKSSDESVPQTVLRASGDGLTYQAVPGDGHCLFHAVGLYVGRSQEDLRREVVDHIASHREEYRSIIEALEVGRGRSIGDYLNAVRNGSEWADNLEITVLMKVLNRPIVIMGPAGRIQNPGDVNRYPGNPIFVYYNGHNHYDGLLLTDEYRNRSRDVLANLTQFGEHSHSDAPSRSPVKMGR